jgi:hypothetical protein
MYKAKLQRVIAGYLSGLRTKIVEGECHDLPKTGRPFILFGPPLESKVGIRYVETTPVSELLIAHEADFSFRTASGSTYLLWVEKIPDTKEESSSVNKLIHHLANGV